MYNRSSRRVLHTHEGVASLHFALVAVAFLFLLGPASIERCFSHVDWIISRNLGLIPIIDHPKEEVSGGYFAFFIPVLTLAICLYAALRMLADTALSRQFLGWLTGIVSIAGPPGWLICLFVVHGSNWSLLQVCEVAFVLALWCVYRSRSVRIPDVAFIFVLFLHWGLWLWFFGIDVQFGGYFGPVAPTAGLCASLTWAAYWRQSQHDGEATNLSGP